MTSQPKPRTVRDAGYLRWLRKRPCCWCFRAPPSDPSHHGRRGVGIKASDLDAIALCRKCHSHHHGPRYGNAPPLPEAPPDLDVRAWAATQAEDLRALYELEKSERGR